MADVADDAGTLLAIALLLLRMRARARSLSLNLFAESVCRCWKPRHLHAFRTAGLACACAMLLRPMRGCSCLGTAARRCMRMPPCARPWLYARTLMQCHRLALSCLIRGCSCVCTTAGRTDMMRMRPQSCPELHASAPVEHLWLLEVAARTRRAVHLLPRGLPRLRCGHTGYSVLRTASAPCAAHPGASTCTLEEWGPPE